MPLPQSGNPSPSLPLPALRRARVHAELAGLNGVQAARAVTQAQRRCAERGGEAITFWHALYVELAPHSERRTAGDPVTRALAGLALEERTALLLRLGEGLLPARIARVLDEPEPRAAAHLASALRRLRGELAAGRSDALWLAEIADWLHAHEPASARLPDAASPPASASLAAARPAWTPPTPAPPASPARRWLWIVLACGLLALGLAHWPGIAWLDGTPKVPAAAPADPRQIWSGLSPVDAGLIASALDFELLARLDFYLWLRGREVAEPLVASAPPSSATVPAGWDTLSATEVEARAARVRNWQALTPAEQAALRLNLPIWHSLAGADQQQLVALKSRHQVAPPSERTMLDRAFEALTPAARRALLPSVQADDLRALAQAVFQFVPADEETPTLAMLATLDSAEQAQLRTRVARMPPWQREALRRELLAMSIDARRAWLSENSTSR